MLKPTINAEIRNNKGKRGVKVLKREGYIPAIVYGHNIESKNIKLKKNDIEKIANNYEVGSSITLNINDNTTMAIIKDIQRDITKGNIIHVDFQELTKGKKVRVRIPIHIVNKASVESSVSVVQEQLKEIEIQTIPKYLPQAINVDASLLKEKEAIKVEDLDIYNDENIEILTDASQIISTLAYATKQETAATEEKSLTDLY